MSAVASPTQGARGRSAGPSIPMTRLVGVELRKMVDTRAGRWLLIGVGAVTAVVLGIVVATGDAGDRSFFNLVAVAQLPLSILLPVLGVLAATSEWSQRTVLTTFSLVPSRGRVLTAKIAAASLVAVGAVAFAIVAAALAALIAPLIGTTDAKWSLGLADIGEMLVFQELSMMLGVALGTLLLNSALAIVLYFVLPTVWSGLAEAIGALKDVQPWLDTSSSWIGLINPDIRVDGTAWAQAGVSALLWIVLPLSVGLARQLRKEVD